MKTPPTWSAAPRRCRRLAPISLRRSLAFVLGGYLLGAVPVPYLVGRVFGRADLLESGTGSAGASNLWHTPAGWAVAPVGVAQMAQGALPPLVARRAGCSEGVQVAAGLASIVGQDWNMALGLRGGRGLTHSIGFLLAVSRPSLVPLAVFGLAGVVLRQIPLGMLLGLSMAAASARAVCRPPAVVAGCRLMLALAAAKRVEANRRPFPEGQPVALTLLYRALFDRDVRSRDDWLENER